MLRPYKGKTAGRDAGVPRGPEKQNGRPGLKRDARFVFL
jgi:hypothetical protein